MVGGTIGVILQGTGGGGAFLLVVYFLLIVAYIAGIWKTLSKAGEPGWAAIIPIYNIYKLLKIGGYSGLWVIGIFIPILNIVVAVIVAHGVSRSFGQGIGFTIGLWILGFIFYPIIGFGDYQYQGPPEAEDLGSPELE